MGGKVAGCPECPHCQAEAKPTEAPTEAPTTRLRAATRRPWQQPHYGEKLTGIVD